MRTNKALVAIVGLLVLGLIIIFGVLFPIPTLKTSQPPNFVLKDDYFSEVQAIFDGRCVACHSCFNAPCQLNLSSYEGALRGASKANPYDFPLTKPQPPTRLGIDAENTQQWRQKGFFPVLASSLKKPAQKISDSLFLQLIHAAPEEVDPKRTYHSEKSRICPKGNITESYLKNHGMPFGLPKLEKDEIKTLTEWVLNGAPGPSEKTQNYFKNAYSKTIKNEIIEWEKLLNKKTYKHQLSARYLYEHLFSAHINFDSDPNEFFRIVRASNSEGYPKEIATTRPFDDPKTKEFYYRFKKVSETITHKSHIVFLMNKKILSHYRQAFLQASWEQESDSLPGYGKDAANPFLVFKNIPAQARYEFFLNNARYFIMTFIKGPVCRGQTALNVINDHFWVMFIDPQSDITVSDPKYLEKVLHLMAPPASEAEDFDIFNEAKEKRWQAHKIKTQSLTDSLKTLGPKDIWNGFDGNPNPNALLTVYRHFDSSSVLWGAKGVVPKTVWVMDYQIFEDIYYNLVAGYNVFGPVLHQINTRLYMDISRISSEDMFLNFMPAEQRKDLRTQWSAPSKPSTENLSEVLFQAVEKDILKKVKFDYDYFGQNIQTSFKTQTSNPKFEFLKLLMNERFQAESFYKPTSLAQEEPKDMTVDLQEFDLQDKTIKALNSIYGKNFSFIEAFPDASLLRIKNNKGEFKVFSILRNKFHYNVSMMFFESKRRNPSLDTLDILPEYATSYPNYFFDLNEEEVLQMIAELKSSSETDSACKILQMYGVSRNERKIWRLFDWFTENFKESDPIEAGILDLNRYISANCSS